jgi:hypothetical protein
MKFEVFSTTVLGSTIYHCPPNDYWDDYKFPLETFEVPLSYLRKGNENFEHIIGVTF